MVSNINHSNGAVLLAELICAIIEGYILKEYIIIIIPTLMTKDLNDCSLNIYAMLITVT
ncbi:hypothetical protein ACF3M2_09230 [Tissierella carlieri]